MNFCGCNILGILRPREGVANKEALAQHHLSGPRHLQWPPLQWPTTSVATRHLVDLDSWIVGCLATPTHQHQMLKAGKQVELYRGIVFPGSMVLHFHVSQSECCTVEHSIPHSIDLLVRLRQRGKFCR